MAQMIRFTEYRFYDGRTEIHRREDEQIELSGAYQSRQYRRQEFERDGETFLAKGRYFTPWLDETEVAHSEPITNAPCGSLLMMTLRQAKPRWLKTMDIRHPAVTRHVENDSATHHPAVNLRPDDLDWKIERANAINAKWAKKYGVSRSYETERTHSFEPLALQEQARSGKR